MRASPTLPLAAPSGMEDHLPAATRRRTSLSGRLLALFESYGYERVITPAFEYAEVLERGLEIDRRDVLRFVEPETGEVALLRPDITPQIARIVATRLRDRPAPWRLCYQGTVVRQRVRTGRARTARQRTQVGVEHIGTPTQDADAEVLELAIGACRTAGLRDFRIELGHVRIGRTALASLPDALRMNAADALARKDVKALEDILARGDTSRADRTLLLTLADLYGDADVLKTARTKLTDATSRVALDEIESLRDAMGAAGTVLGVDLGELRGHAYYTGVSFSILAEGPGEPIGGGGRYDGLLSRFGVDVPATGFGLDLDHLFWALTQANTPWQVERPLRLVVVGAPELTRAWRARGVQVAGLGQGSDERALAFAQAWGYDGAFTGAGLWRVHDGKRRNDAAEAEPAELEAWLRSEE
ncbi:MAG: ATP phosphoribosyltransferase regulatory subunit [Myxococcota bacterium]